MIFSIPFENLPTIVLSRPKNSEADSRSIVHKIAHRLVQVTHYALLFHFHAFIFKFYGHFFN